VVVLLHIPMPFRHHFAGLALAILGKCKVQNVHVTRIDNITARSTVVIIIAMGKLHTGV